jgi:molecular chaperone GrpE
VNAEQPDAGPAPPGGPDPAPDAPKHTEPVVQDRRRVRITGKHADPSEPDRPADPSGAASAGPEPAGGAGPPAGPEPEDGGGEPAGGLGAELAALRTALDERTRDLQRITAEYANYRKRVERDRALVGEQATANVLSALLPVLDDLDRAREHGELVEGVAAVAEQLVATTSKFGLTAFGERGDPFDPNRHEAVAHLTSPEVTEPTCVDVLRRGYLLGNRLLRPAMVAVADPAGPGATEAPDAGEPAEPPEAGEPGEPAGPAGH